MELDSPDALGYAVLEAIARAPRISFSRLGTVLGVSDHTVARHYRLLRERLGFRVVASVGPGGPGAALWFLRLRCSPDAASGVARALAARDDTMWVEVVSGGTEVACSLSLPAAEQGAGQGSALLEKLASGRHLVGISAHAILHRYSAPLWPRLTGHLTAAQVEAIEAEAAAGREAPRSRGGLDDLDREMLALLAQDARTPVAQLAALTGLHESSARRRLDQLLRSGHVTFEVDLDWFPGAGMHVLLWASVDPAELDNVGKALSNEPYVPFAAATTGPTNLLASVVASGAEDLYSWLTSHLGRNLGIERVETAPVMKVLKRHGQLTAHTLSVSAGRARSAS